MPEYPTERGELPGLTPEDKELFLKSLENLYKKLDRKLPTPIICGSHLDLARLYHEVCKRGGLAQAVTDRQMTEISRGMGYRDAYAAASQSLKSNYEKILLVYEENFFQPKKLPNGGAAPLSRSRSSRSDLGSPSESSGLPPPASAPPATLNSPPYSDLLACAPAPSLRTRPPSPSPITPAPRAWAPAVGSADSSPPAAASPTLEPAPKRKRTLTDQPFPFPPATNEVLRRQCQASEAEFIQASMPPDIGPMFKVDGLPEALSQMISALQSGVPSAVSWALNALGVASKQTHGALQVDKEGKLLAALVELIKSGLSDTLPTAAPLMQAEQQYVPLEIEYVAGKRYGGAMEEEEEPSCSSNPEIPWWEAEEGLLADASGDAFVWSICASSILANLASTSDGNVAMASSHSSISVLLECLKRHQLFFSIQYHLKGQTDGTAELAFHALRALSQLAAQMQASSSSPTGDLLNAVVCCIKDEDSLWRLRVQAACTFGKLAENDSLAESVAACSWRAVPALVAILEAPSSCFLREVSSGRDAAGPGGADAHISYLSSRTQEVSGYRLWAMAQVSASFALSKLCKRTGTVEAVVATPRAVSCLIAILLGNRPSFAAEFNCMLAKESSTHFQFPTLGRAFSHLSARACGDAALALAALANMRPPPEELIAAEGVLAEAALSPSGNNAVLGILGTLTRC